MARLFKKNDYYYAEWRDPSRHPKRKTVALEAKDKRIANKRFMHLSHLNAEGKYDPWTDARPQENATLAEAVARFIKSRKVEGCTAKTISTYTETLRLLENMAPAGLLLRQVEPKYVALVVNQESLSDASRESYHRRLRTFFSWCVKHHLLQHSPLESIRAPKPMRQEAEFLTAEQAGMLLRLIEEDAGDRTDKRQRNMQWLADVVRFALYTGLRRGEIVNLHWSNVDLDNGFIVIRNTEDFRTKSGHERRVPLVAGAREVLERLAAEQGCSVTGYIFTNEEGDRLYGPFVAKRFRDYRRKAGLSDNIHWHSLRHTAASWLVMKGVSLRIVQEILGHSSAAVTQRYAHLAPDALKREMERAFADSKVAEPFRLYSAGPVQKGAESCSSVQYMKAA